ncbi:MULTISPECIES: element excision factor XisH family protein [Spirulina sp. CCY15215]|uniref:element excision factor XisH family protein n=1 Tax=Spirulina sp. CCY15215 TaxID=2767591 RepID=UPI0032AEB892
MGQTLNYRLALKKKEMDRKLYLAIEIETYEDFFTRQFIQSALQEYQVKLLIFDAVMEEIRLWKE